MNCPKCGFVQEERPDCAKCGVVFSKYYALYPSTRPAPPGRPPDPVERELVERQRQEAITDLQQQIRELNARFVEMEFEKAERNQLRADFKNLEKLLHEDLDVTFSRLAEYERHLGDGSVIDRLEAVERKTEVLSVEDDHSSPPRISELEDQLSALREQVAQMSSLIDQPQNAQSTEEPQKTIEQDVRAIRKNLDELRRLITSARND